jgi:hypothetical protein
MYRKIREKNDNENAQSPVMPLLIMLPDNTIFESDSITGLVGSILGNDYINTNENNKCLMRIKLARRESISALQYGLNTIITNGKKIIKNNYAASDEDEDYEYTNDEKNESIVIRIDNEKDFILSLIKIETIRVFEKVNSNIFLNEKTESDTSKNEYIEVLF